MSAKISALEKLHTLASGGTLASGDAPDSHVYWPTDGQVARDEALTFGDLRAIRTRLEELERALHGGRDRDKERREFVRGAAIANSAAIGADGDAAFSDADCWQFARSLWDAKPEDC